MTANTNPFRKARQDHVVETSEDYVEVIFRLGGSSLEHECESAKNVKTSEIARTLEVAQPTVTKILNRLESEGLICIHRRQFVHLTEDGLKLAKESFKRHELIVKFLRKLGVSEFQAELDTEGMEHHISDETLEAFEAFLRKNET